VRSGGVRVSCFRMHGWNSWCYSVDKARVALTNLCVLQVYLGKRIAFQADNGYLD
jgi:hypothetical protein